MSREEFGVSAKVTRLGLSGANYDKFQAQVRSTSVFGQSEPLPLTEYPVNDAVAGDSIPVAVAPDGLEAGRHLLIRGKRVSDGVAIIHGATLVAAVSGGHRPQPVDHRSAAAGAAASRLGGGARQRGAGDSR